MRCTKKNSNKISIFFSLVVVPNNDSIGRYEILSTWGPYSKYARTTSNPPKVQPLEKSSSFTWTQLTNKTSKQ